MVPFALIFTLIKEALNKVLSGNWETKIDDILDVHEEVLLLILYFINLDHDMIIVFHFRLKKTRLAF